MENGSFRFAIVSEDGEYYRYKHAGVWRKPDDLATVLDNSFEAEATAKNFIKIETSNWQKEKQHAEELYRTCHEKFVLNRIKKAETNIEKLSKASVLKVLSDVRFEKP